MKVCIQGLWHLGCVTAGCMVSLGNEIIGFDEDSSLINDLQNGKTPIFEPNLDCLIQKGIEENTLTFTDKYSDLAEIDILWIAYDTPVDDYDNADSNYVIEKIKASLPYLQENTIVLISSQVPIGTINKLQKYVNGSSEIKKIFFAYSPENLRLGNAVDIFLNPERIIIGCEEETSKTQIYDLISKISTNIVWMKPASAEMVKHGINSYLAMSICFMNELSTISEKYNADSKEVEKGLRSDPRIGLKSYVSPGGPFAGGTLARDVAYLIDSSKNIEQSNGSKFKPHLLNSIINSNNSHKDWLLNKIIENFHTLSNTQATFWGLTYKSNTNTLRRSEMVKVIDKLIAKKVVINLYDPFVQEHQLPQHWKTKINWFKDPIKAILGSDFLVIGSKNEDNIRNFLEVETKLKKQFKVFDTDYTLFSIFKKQTNAAHYFAVGYSYQGKDI